MKRIILHVEREVTKREYTDISMVVHDSLDIKNHRELRQLLEEWEEENEPDFLDWEEGFGSDDVDFMQVDSADDSREDPLLDPRDADEDEYVTRAVLLEHQTGSIYLVEPGVPSLFVDDKETTS